MDIFKALTRHGPLRAGNPEGELNNFVVVAPQLPAAGDSWYRYTEVVCQIVSGEAAKYRCDRSRIYLTGFSFGGNGVFDLAIARPDLWAALWVVDPTRVPTQTIDAPIWVSLGEIARHQAGGFVRRLRLDARDIAPRSRRLWSDDGEGHVGTARLAYGNREIYRWLLNWTLTLPAFSTS